MSQPPQPPTEPEGEPRKGRPFGPFLIFTSLLILALVAFGQGGSSRTLTQDEFWFSLRIGDVQNLQIKGSRPCTVSGEIDSLPESERRFTVQFPSADGVTETIRALNAKRVDSKKWSQAEFFGAVTRNTLHPVRGYHISYLKELNLAPDQRFFADVDDGDGTHYIEVLPSSGSLELARLRDVFQSRNAEIERHEYKGEGGLLYDEGGSIGLYFLGTLWPILLFIGLFYFLFLRQMRGGAGGNMLSFGRSRPVVYNKDKHTSITFADVAGIDEAKSECEELIEFLREPAKFTRLGGRMPRGVLLVGGPGCGKTLLAKAIAGEAGVPFLSISGSDFVEMFVGVGASRVRDLFKQARESAPCIIFLDEIDAVGRKRGSGMGGGHDEREQTLNAILVEMDGFDTDLGIIVIAATNRPDVLDPALLRPGRFDREIVIDMPDLKGREAILAVHATKIQLAEGVELEVVARSTPGFSGAELEALINEAAITAVMRGAEKVALVDLEEARDKVRFGREKRSRVMSDEDKRITAVHEAGHAVVAENLEKAETVHKVTIIPRGMALGATMILPDKDHAHTQREQLNAELAVLYGGRIAEELICGDISAGAQNDIQRATYIARLMVCEWGMSDKVGAVNYSERLGSEFLGQEFSVGKDYSEATIREIDEEVRAILDTAFGVARDIIQANRAELESTSEALLRYETITGAEVKALSAGTSVDDLRPDADPEPEVSPSAEAEAQSANGTQPDGEASGDVSPGSEGLAPA